MRMMTESSARFVMEAKAVTLECCIQERIVGFESLVDWMILKVAT